MPRRARPWILALALLAPATAHAGAWAPEPGHGYVKIWLKYLFGFSYSAGNGTVYDYGGYHELFVATYAELGIVPRVALVLHSDVVRTFFLEDTRTGTYEGHLGPGDPQLTLRWQFLSAGRFAGSVEAGARLPFARPGPVQPFYGRGEGQPLIGALQIGTGVWDFPLTVSIGHGWDDWYLQGSVGWVMRTSGYDHVFAWTAEGGTTISRQWGLRGRVGGWHPVDVWFGDRAPGHDSPSGIGNGTTYLGFALEGDYQFRPDWYVGATIEGGLGLLRRQTGGPVVSLYLAARY